MDSDVAFGTVEYIFYSLLQFYVFPFLYVCMHKLSICISQLPWTDNYLPILVEPERLCRFQFKINLLVVAGH